MRQKYFLGIFLSNEEYLPENLAFAFRSVPKKKFHQNVLQMLNVYCFVYCRLMNNDRTKKKYFYELLRNRYLCRYDKKYFGLVL